ncbi:MAG: alpha/beta hydrolase [Candidatus Woesearchaeota archaeon]
MKTTDPERKYFTTKQGYKIFYLIKRFNNSKPFIYFQHGLTGNHTVWKGHMDYMIEHKQPFIIIDLLGHGLSQKAIGKDCYSVKNYGDYLLQVLEHEKIKDYFMIGQCFGGMIGLYNEIHRKTKSKALVLIGVPLRNPAKHFVHRWAEPFSPLLRVILTYIPVTLGWLFGRKRYPLINYNNHTKRGRISIFLLDMIGTPKIAYGWTLYSMSYTNLAPHLKKVKKPVMLVYGEGDLKWMKEPYAQMKEAFDNPKTVILKNVDHLVTMRAPIQLSKEIIKFMKEIKK